MKIIEKIILNQAYINLPFTLRKVCRVIRDNIKIDVHMASIAMELNLTPNSNKIAINDASLLLYKRLPYFSLIKMPSNWDGESYNLICPVRLVKASKDNIYKTVLETNIISFLHNLLNDNINKGIILNLGDYVMLDEEGKIIRNFTNLYKKYEPRYLRLDDNIISRSHRLKFLMNLQLKDTPIYTLTENPSHKSADLELSYIFTIRVNGEIRTIVYENPDPSKATYIFEIIARQFNEALNVIRHYFSSPQVNKRLQLLKNKHEFTLENGIKRFYRILHDDNIVWETKIEYICAGFSL